MVDSIRPTSNSIPFLLHFPAMARPWEYPRWRRWVMQLVMWLILGATVGLAELITYQRNHMPIELGPPVQLGQVDVRLPAGWRVGAAGSTLEAQDPETGRVVRVMYNPALLRSEEPPPDQGGAPVSTEPIEFHGLHRRGLMAAISQYQMSAQGLVTQPVLRAAAELPGQKLVVVEVSQYAAQMGPADRLLLQTVADGISLASGKAPPAPAMRPQNAEPESPDDSE
jgi:hypothetical protein